MYYIYKITSPSGKVYIGQHSWQGEGLDPNYFCSSGNPHFWNAVEKYGIENFTKEIIEIVDDKSLLNDRETYWIQQYFGDNCYNLNPIGGGGGGWAFLSHEQCVKGGKRGGRKTVDVCKPNGSGIFSEESRRKLVAILKENHLGFYSLDVQRAGAAAANEVNKRNGTAVYDPLVRQKGRDTLRELGLGTYNHDNAVAYGKRAAIRQKELGINFFSSEFQSEQGKKGIIACKEKGVGVAGNHDIAVACGKKAVSIHREKNIGLFDPEHTIQKLGTVVAHIKYEWFLSDGITLVYIGDSSRASRMMRKRNQVWIKGEEVPEELLSDREWFEAHKLIYHPSAKTLMTDGIEVITANAVGCRVGRGQTTWDLWTLYEGLPAKEI